MILGFTGPFGDHNFGDYGMLVNDIYNIKADDNVIFTDNHKFLENMQSGYFENCNISICSLKVRDTEQNEEPKLSDKYSVELNDYPSTAIEILNEVSNLDELYLEVAAIEKLIVVGGGYFNSIWNAKHRRKKLVAILAPILVASNLNKEIIFLGNTYGPFNKCEDMFSSFFSSLRNYKLCARDNLYSITNIRRLGISENVEIIPDDLYFLSDRLKEESSSSIRNKEYIIIELYCSISDLEENSAILKEFLMTMKETYNLEPLFLPFDTKYGGEFQGNYIKTKCFKELSIYEIKKEGFQRIECVNTLVKNAKFILCQRYHLFLFGMANNVPSLQILKDVCGDKRYYYCKSNGLLKQIFSNQNYQENLFFGLDLHHSLKYIMTHLNDIILNQKLLFNNKKIEAENIMIESRNNLINYINRGQ